MLSTSIRECCISETGDHNCPRSHFNYTAVVQASGFNFARHHLTQTLSTKWKSPHSFIGSEP